MNKHFWIVLLSLCLSAPLALRSGIESEDCSGKSAIHAFCQNNPAGESDVVLGLVGFYGQPDPPQWLVLTAVDLKKGLYRESVLRDKEIVAVREFRKVRGQDIPEIPIDPDTLKVTSEEAFNKAHNLALQRRVSFESVHFQLRCRDLEKEPVWMLNLLNTSHVSIGVVYISAKSGEVLRENWHLPPVEQGSPEEILSRFAPTD